MLILGKSHSRAKSRNSRVSIGLHGERDWESAMADRPPDSESGNCCPQPSDAAGQSVDIAG